MGFTPHDDRSFWPAAEAQLSPALGVLTSAGCGACRRLKALLEPLGDELGVPLWELDAHAAPGVAAELEVFHLPALFVVAQGEAALVHAEATPAGLRALLEGLRAR